MYSWETHTCATLLATFKDTALFFVCKRTMSEMKSCISSILKSIFQIFNLILTVLPYHCNVQLFYGGIFTERKIRELERHGLSILKVFLLISMVF